jgi:hypothetical protein
MAKLTKPARDRVSATKFAFPKQRKEPLENASHVRNAVARFNQVKGVTEAELVPRGSGYRLPQSDMEWNLKSEISANTPACTPAEALRTSILRRSKRANIQTGSAVWRAHSNGS